MILLTDVFKGAFSRDTWERRALPNIHVYGFSKAADPEAEYAEVSHHFDDLSEYGMIIFAM